MELRICILVPNLSTADIKTYNQKLDLTAPHFSSSVNEKRLAMLASREGNGLNTSSGSTDATAILVRKLAITCKQTGVS